MDLEKEPNRAINRTNNNIKLENEGPKLDKLVLYIINIVKLSI